MCAGSQPNSYRESLSFRAIDRAVIARTALRPASRYGSLKGSPWGCANPLNPEPEGMNVMSRKLFIVAFAALSFACATGASANEYSRESAPIARDNGSASLVPGFGLDSEGAQPGAPSIDGGDSHVMKTGLWSDIKSAAKKVGSGVVKAGKAVANSPVGRVGVKVTKGVSKVTVPVGKAVWNNGPIKGVRNAIKAVKVIVLKKKP
jgi:hypothetical protein